MRRKLVGVAVVAGFIFVVGYNVGETFAEEPTTITVTEPAPPPEVIREEVQVEVPVYLDMPESCKRAIGILDELRATDSEISTHVADLYMASISLHRNAVSPVDYFGMSEDVVVMNDARDELNLLLGSRLHTTQTAQRMYDECTTEVASTQPAAAP